MIYTVDTEEKTIVIRGAVTVLELIEFAENPPSIGEYKILVEEIPQKLNGVTKDFIENKVFQPRPYDNTGGNPYRVNYTVTKDVNGPTGYTVEG